MKRSLIIAVFIAKCIAAAAESAAASESGIEAVFVAGGEIAVLSDTEQQIRMLTSSGSAKFLPVWSKDGTRIAFIEDAGRDSFGNIVVIDGAGRELSRSQFRQVDDSLGGMRFIESLEWLADDRVAVSGSVNPSLTETAIVDLRTNAVESGIFDDGLGATFSPDGNHFAYAAGSPHFTPEDSQEPALHIDYLRVFPARDRHITFVSERQWSPDSERLAVVAEDFHTKRRMLVIWRRGEGVSEIALPLTGASINSVLWSGEAVLISSQSGVLRVEADGRSVENVSSQYTVKQLGELKARRAKFLEIVRKFGGRDLDLWCQTCGSPQPRRVSVNNQ